MSRSILILLGHPDRDSLCGALAQRYATAAENAGHRVRLIALGDLEFDPVLRHGYRQIQPLGFNWQICIALIPGLAAREVAVSSLATVYALSAADDDAASQALTPLISDGWSLATALSLLVWYIYAPMCISTLATIKRETNSWKTMAFSAFYLFAAAYVAALITYQVTKALGGG